MKRYQTVMLALCAALIAMPSAVAQEELDAAFEHIAKYSFGQSREPFSVVTDAIRDSHDNPELRNDIVNRLVKILGPGSTVEAKDFACRQLAIVGGDEAVPALAALLTAEETSNMARFALERIPGQKADDALLQALQRSAGLVRMGIINTLGERRTAAAAPPLASLAKDNDPQTAAAACAALAKIASDEAVKAIANAEKPAADPARTAWAEAMVVAADNLAARDKAAAVEIYNKLAAPELPKAIQVAAFIGKVNALGAQALEDVVQAMKSGDVEMRRAASMFVRTIEGEQATAAFAQLYEHLDPGAQVLLIAALTDRADPAALPAVLTAAASTEFPVRAAAYNAMAELGNAEVIPQLLTAATGERQEQEAARLALNSLKGEDIDPALAAALESVDDAQKAEIARALAARGAYDATPALLKTAAEASDGVKREAFRALTELAAPNHLPSLIDLLVKTEAETPRREAERAVAAVARRIQGGPSSAQIVGAIERTRNRTAVASLLATLPMIGDENGLQALQRRINARNAEVRDAAVRAISSWPSDTALPDALNIAKNTNEDNHRVLALRGMLRMLDLNKDRDPQEALAYLSDAIEVAKGDDDMKMILGGLANVRDLEALNLVRPYIAEENLRAEAEMAAQAIFKGMCKPTASHNSGQASHAVDSNMDSRWTTGEPQKPGQWFALDMGQALTVSKITLETRDQQDYPRGYQVFVSNDNENWGDPVAEGAGTSAVTSIEIAPTEGRHIRIVQTGSDEQMHWSINQVSVDFK